MLFKDPAHTFYLIDISSFIFRAYYAIRRLSNRKGEPTNAVFGVATMLTRLIQEAGPKHLAVLYDSKAPSFRKEVYAQYKANRTAPPDDLIPQFDRIEKLIEAMGIRSFRRDGVEADDLIATLTKRWKELSPKNRVVIVTGDKDLMQLVDEGVCVWDTMKEKVYHSKEVEEKFGLPPQKVRDYLALVGDSSDNIPGVPSIGPKGAVDLLKEFDTLEGVLKAAQEGKIPGKKGEVLKSHADDARISYQLAGLSEELIDKIDLDEFTYHFSLSDSCVALLRDLEFHTLVEKWGQLAHGHASQEGSPHVEAAEGGGALARRLEADPRFRLVQTEAELAQVLGEIEKSGRFGFDLETTSLNPRQAMVVGVSLCATLDHAYYIPVGHRGVEGKQLPEALVMERVLPFLLNKKYRKIGQNLKYDWSVLYQRGVFPEGIEADTMVAAYVLDPSGRYSLEQLCLKYLGYQTLTYEEVCGKGPNQIGFDQVPLALAARYSAEDSLCALQLWDHLRPLLEKEGLMEVFNQVDMPLVAVLTGMEKEGISVDLAWLKKLSREFEIELSAIEDRIRAFTSGPVNLNSPRQLAQLLFEELKLPTQGKTKTGLSTDFTVLEALAPLHEVPRLLLEYREISKLKGTYVDPLPGMVDPKTGKIHTSFSQVTAATGRLASSSPNLQNIPIRTERGRKIRRAFIPSPGGLLVSADYSQIELRLLAHMSQDPALVSAFVADEDVHRKTAAEIFSVQPEAVTDEQRGIAKAIGFGLMYGKTAFGLAQELKIPRAEAKAIIDRYFERYSAVKRFLDGLIEQARDKGWTQTLMGRRRKLPDLHARNPMVRANAERMAMNTPIQGTAADLIKLAMIGVANELDRRKMKSRLILQVHDELVLDCPEAEAEASKKLVEEVMEGAMKLSVPLRVNSAIGRNWMEL